MVIYDISDDNLRNAVSEVCKDFGLLRIQRSAFIGNLTSSRRKELRDKLKEVLGDSNGNIQLFAICQADMALREIIGKEISEEVPSISFV